MARIPPFNRPYFDQVYDHPEKRMKHSKNPMWNQLIEEINNCTTDSDCQDGFVAVNGECVPNPLLNNWYKGDPSVEKLLKRLEALPLWREEDLVEPIIKW